jgi:hypothetical protein
MENIEAIVHELTQLETSEGKEELPKILEDYLLAVAKTGGTLVPWPKLKTLFRLKLEAVIKDFVETSPVENVPKMPNVEPFRFDELKQRIFEQGGGFGIGRDFWLSILAYLLAYFKI